MYLPQNYQEWYRCITEHCRIVPNEKFLQSRIRAMNNKDDSYTQSFIQLYGPRYHRQVLEWFEKAIFQLYP